MASLDDILTTQKNGVVAINNYTNAILRGQGVYTSATVTADTLVVTGRGYLVSVSIVDGGTVEGGIYNYNSNSGYSASQQLLLVGTTPGVVAAGMVFTSGLVIAPGAGQAINVTYSLG